MMRKNIDRRLISLGVAVLICLAQFPTALAAGPTATAGDFQVTGNARSYQYSDGVLTIVGSDPLIIQNIESRKTTDRILISSAADVTLAGVHIDVQTVGEVAALDVVAGEEDVVIRLQSDSSNDLISGKNCAGLQKAGGSGGKLTIEGSDTSVLNATGGMNGSGIGGGDSSGGPPAEKVVGHIEINGGHIVAYAGAGGTGAGIGGPEATDITINGGFVDSNATKGGAGIGGASGDGHDITITGGRVYAWAGDYTGYDTDAGAGIGGSSTGSGYNILITGGEVKGAGGGAGGAGIGSGGGAGLSAHDVAISGGYVQGVAYTGAPGIGSGSVTGGSCSNIAISGGTVVARITVSGVGSANGIGTVDGTGVSGISITGGSVFATALGARADLGAAPTGADGSLVYPVDLIVDKLGQPETVGSVTTALNGGSQTFLVNGVTCDTGNGRQSCRVYLPENSVVSSAVVGKEGYSNLGADPIRAEAGRIAAGTISNVSGNFVVEGGQGGVDYSFDVADRILHIRTDTPLRIANRAEGSTADRIVIDGGVGAELTLDGLFIDLSASGSGSPLELVGSSSARTVVHLARGSDNRLLAGSGSAAVQKGSTDSLLIDGDGALSAQGGGSGAGIGGAAGETGDAIEIAGGTVLAVGGRGADGIGSGAGSTAAAQNLRITGGSVVARAGEGGRDFSARPVGSKGEPIYRVRFCLPDDGDAPLRLTAVVQQGQPAAYASSDIIPLSGDSDTPVDGWVSLWLPAQQLGERSEVHLTSAQGERVYTGTLQNSDDNRLKMEQEEIAIALVGVQSPVYGDSFRVEVSGGLSDSPAEISTSSGAVQLSAAGGNFIGVGPYSITARAPGNAYYWDAEKTLSGSVAPRTVKLEWSGTDRRIYDGQTSRVSARVANALPGDEVGVLVSGGDAREIGVHRATAVALTGNEGSFYTLSGTEDSIPYEIAAGTEADTGPQEEEAPPLATGAETLPPAATGDVFAGWLLLILSAVVLFLLGRREVTR